MRGIHPKSHLIQCWFWKIASPWEWKTWAHFPRVPDKAALIHLHFITCAFPKQGSTCQVHVGQKSLCFHLYSGLGWHGLNVLVSSIDYKELGVRTQSSKSALSFLHNLLILKAEPLVPYVSDQICFGNTAGTNCGSPSSYWEPVCESREVTIGTTARSPQTFA